MRRADPPLPSLFDRAQARARGMTDRQITYRLASGRWIAERRGVFRVASADDDRLPFEILAALRTISRGSAVIAGASAACCWGLPRPLDGWGEVTLTMSSGVGRRRNGVSLRIAPLTDADVLVQGGYAVTAPARTVADCLRILPAVDALAIADAALHRRLLTPEQLQDAVTAQSGWPGAVSARKVFALADGRRESPLESWSAWAFAQEELTSPEWQVELAPPGGRTVARVDAWWPEGVVGEADGKAKYALAAAERSGVCAEGLLDVLEAERRREHDIRRLRVDVVRWGAADVLRLGPRAELATHLREARQTAADKSRFRGTVLPRRDHSFSTDVHQSA